MARKPLIEQGSILAGPDTLSRVILRDREQSGRHSPTPAADDPIDGPPDTHPGTRDNTADDTNDSPLALTSDSTIVYTTGSMNAGVERGQQGTDREAAGADAGPVNTVPDEGVPYNGEDLTDPIKRGYWSVIRQPLSANYRRGPFTTSSVRVSTEVWDRLKAIKAFLGKDQQDILADALADYFEKVQSGQVRLEE